MAKWRRRRGWYWREGSSGLPYWEGRGSSRLPCRGPRGSSGLPGLVTRGSWRLARNQDGAWGPSLALLARGLLRGRQLFVKSSSIWNRTTPFSGRIPAESDSQSQLYTSYIFYPMPLDVTTSTFRCPCGRGIPGSRVPLIYKGRPYLHIVYVQILA